MLRFESKVAVVTGGARGIGAGCGEIFYRDGARVALLDIDGEAVQAKALSIDPSGEAVIGIQCNIADRTDVKRAFSEIISKFGTVDFLVNNAGIARDAMFHKMTEEQWDQVMLVNGKGLFNVAQEAYLIMREKRYGKIVNVSSTVSSGVAGQSNYAFTKAGILGFTKSLAKEAGRYNIHVNAVRPGLINTEMMNAVPEDILKGYMANTAFNRMGTIEETAGPICYLCSEEAGWIHGEELIVGGGIVYR